MVIVARPITSARTWTVDRMVNVMTQVQMGSVSVSQATWDPGEL